MYRGFKGLSWGIKLINLITGVETTILILRRHIYFFHSGHMICSCPSPFSSCSFVRQWKLIISPSNLFSTRIQVFLFSLFIVYLSHPCAYFVACMKSNVIHKCVILYWLCTLQVYFRLTFMHRILGVSQVCLMVKLGTKSSHLSRPFCQRRL